MPELVVSKKVILMPREKKQKIDKEMLEQALDRHTEALFKRRAGSDATPYKQNAEAAALFHLNKELHAALVPVEPSDAFMEHLRIGLMAAHGKEMSRRQRIRPVKKANLAKTALSVFTVATMVARIAAPFVVVIAFLVARRRRTASAAA
jgi:hypothetical protein